MKSLSNKHSFERKSSGLRPSCKSRACKNKKLTMMATQTNAFPTIDAKIEKNGEYSHSLDGGTQEVADESSDDSNQSDVNNREPDLKPKYFEVMKRSDSQPQFLTYVRSKKDASFSNKFLFRDSSKNELGVFERSHSILGVTMTAMNTSTGSTPYRAYGSRAVLKSSEKPGLGLAQ